jgi:hypothetical protein
MKPNGSIELKRPPANLNAFKARREIGSEPEISQYGKSISYTLTVTSQSGIAMLSQELQPHSSLIDFPARQSFIISEGQISGSVS